MTLRYGVLSLLALVTIVLLAIENYETWTAPLQVISEKAGSKKSVTKPDVSRPPGDQKDSRATSSIASYIFIAERNPFHPDRKEFPVVAPPEAQKTEVKKPIVRPQVTLYGVTIVDHYQSATISYPGRPLQKGERETVTVKIGDRVADYKVSQILPDRIDLEAPEDRFQVLLYDAGTPKRRVYAKTENKPATSTSTASGPPAATPEAAKLVPPPGTPPAPGAPRQIPSPPPMAPTPAPSPSVSPAPAPPVPSTPGAAPTYTPGSRTRRFSQPPPTGGQ